MTGTPEKRPAFEPAAQLLRPTGFDPDMPRPGTTVAGAVLVLLRVASGIVLLTVLIAQWGTASSDLNVALTGVDVTPELAQIVLVVVVIAVGAFLLIDTIMAFFILTGHNWARVIVMSFSVISITTAFIQWWSEGQEITINNTLLSVGLDILILLALSSRSAAAYARRKERPSPLPTD